MTLVQLKHFLVLAETGSFTRAAEAVFLTQPAFSRSIRSLEDEFGQPLFDRVGKRNELTPFGREVISRAKNLVFEADELITAGISAKEGKTGPLRIGMGSGPGAMLMTPLLLEISTHHPAIHIEVARGSTSSLVHALRRRELDALVVDVRSVIPASDLKLTNLSRMRGAIMCRHGHPLTRIKGAIRFEALRQYPIASTPLSEEAARSLVEQYGTSAHPQEFVTVRCEEISSLVEVARRSDALLLAIRAAAPDLAELQLKPTFSSIARFGMVTLARRSEVPALAIVRKLMNKLMCG